MTEIILIVALAENNVIGFKNQIPWHIVEDFKRFKSVTLGYPCIMGDVTFESLPRKSRPLPGRENIVLTRNYAYRPSGATIFYDFNHSIEYVRSQGHEKAFIIGGATIYRLALDVVDTLELTHIHKQYDGDVFFPQFNSQDWNIVNTQSQTCVDILNNISIDISYVTYHRK